MVTDTRAISVGWQGDAFLRGLEPVLRECKRVLAPHGNLFINFQAQYVERRMSLAALKLPVMGG